MKTRLMLVLAGIAVLVGCAVFFGITAVTGQADPDLANVAPHRHFINGVQVGPRLCDNLGDPAIQSAFNQFHNNLHIAGTTAIGPAAPGLHNGKGAEIIATPC